MSAHIDDSLRMRSHLSCGAHKLAGEAKGDITDHIVMFYNSTPINSVLGICRAPSVNEKWQHVKLLLCPNLLGYCIFL